MQNGPVMLRTCGMRASDREREATVRILREAYATGRLDLAEVRDRAGAAYSARTWGDLRELIADLPPGLPLPTADRPGVPVWPGTRPSGPQGRPCAPLMLYALAALAMAAVAWIPAAAAPLMILSLSMLFAARCSVPHRDWRAGSRSGAGPGRRADARAELPWMLPRL